MRRAHPAPLAPYVIPRTAHFVFGFGPNDEPFHLVHYLAIASCLDVVQPDEVHVHCHQLPYGFYWDLIRPRVQLHRVEPVAAVRDHEYDDAWIARYRYAHHSDFVRLDVLAERGGLYADIDTLFVAPIPERWWDEETVIGREHDPLDPATGAPRPSVSNALVMAEPGARYIDAWRRRIGDALDGSWSAHSCFLAHDLTTELPDAVHVEPPRTFHAFPGTPDGVRQMLGERVDLGGVVAMHLMAHLWWEEWRRDMSSVHAHTIDERWIRTADTTYAVAARRFLPEHGCF